MLRTIKRQAGGTATTKTGFKTTTKGTPVIIDGKTVYLSDEEYKAKYPTIATVSKKDPELYIKPPLKEVEVVATKPSWMKNREEAEKLPEYSFDKFKENVLPNWAGALGVTKDTMSDETKQQRQDWIDKNYVAPKLFAENKGYYEYTDKEREILDKSNLPDWLKRKEQDIINTSNKLQKEKGVIGSLRTPEDMAKVANATQYRFNTGNKVIDTINPLTGLASMATNLGNARLDLKKGNTGKAFASVITPVIAGAAFNLAGKQSNAQFVADNLSPIPVNADKVVQSVRNYTKSIPKPLLKSTGNRKLVNQVNKNELSLPQASNTRIQIQEISPSRPVSQDVTNSEKQLNEGKKYIDDLIDETNEKYKANYESGKADKYYFIDKTPNPEKSFNTYYIDNNGIKVHMGEVKYNPYRNKKDNGSFDIIRTKDFTTDKLPDNNSAKKGSSYKMTEVLNDIQKEKGGVIYTSKGHSPEGVRRYVDNLFAGKVKVSDSHNDPFDVEIMNRELEKAKKDFNLLPGQRATKSQIEEFIKRVEIGDYKKPGNYFPVRPSSIRYKYLKVGGKKYKYFL